MIAYLEGQLKSIDPPEILLLVNGVGYELEASMQTHASLPALGETFALFTHLTVREDAHKLYGFASREERSLFRTLIKVNGIGPKLALQMLSSLNPNEFIRHVQNEDVAALTQLPGIGKKTAERIIIEIKDKLTPLLNAKMTDATQDQQQDAVNALLALGYTTNEIRTKLKTIDCDTLSTEELIKTALQSFAAQH